MEDKVIIIGGGVGGLCTGIRLLNKGFKVTIIEKNEKLGGKVNLIEEAGFKFDLSASIIMTPKSYTDIFKEVNKNYKDYFTIKKLDMLYKVFYYDKSKINIYNDINLLINKLDKVEKGLSVRFMDFLSKSYNKYFLIKNNFLDKPMISLNEILNKKSIKSLLKINPLSNTATYLDNIIKNEKIKNYLIFTSMYIGVDPYNNSSIYTLIPAISHANGLWYIEGGMYKYIESLEKLFTDLGGIAIKNTSVDEILIKKDKIVGVRVKDKVINSNLVVCNTDYTYAVSNLINKRYANKKDQHINNKEYSCSVFILYLGLDKIYKDLNVHNIYINKNFKENITGPFKGYIPKEPSFYMYYPSIIDKSFCKEGNSVLNVMLRVPNLQISKENYNKDVINKIRNKIIKTLKNIPELKDIEEHIVYENYLTPFDLERKFNCYFGNAFGLSHKLSQNIYFRPHLNSKKIKGLYFLNASTHPGNGTSVVIDGSKVLCNMIIEKE